jgi:hypothetical protein
VLSLITSCSIEILSECAPLAEKFAMSVLEAIDAVLAMRLICSDSTVSKKSIS